MKDADHTQDLRMEYVNQMSVYTTKLYHGLVHVSHVQLAKSPTMTDQTIASTLNSYHYNAVIERSSTTRELHAFDVIFIKEQMTISLNVHKKNVGMTIRSILLMDFVRSVQMVWLRISMLELRVYMR